LKLWISLSRSFFSSQLSAILSLLFLYSRIIAVAHPGNKVLWISDIPGEIQGKPLITESEVSPGEYIFFTHNQDVETMEPYGSFSMIRGDTGALIYTEDAGDSLNDPDLTTLVRVTTLRLPYAPLGVAHEPAFGRYPAGEGNGNDLFIWSTSDGEGASPDGYTRAFQLPRLFQPEFVGKFSVLLRTIIFYRFGSKLISPYRRFRNARHVIFEGKQVERNR
jgi:hypothetical protein